MLLDYYYGMEGEQYSFFRLPKILMRDKRFSSISPEAKLLYSTMLDRMSLSVKNKWLDEQNRVYIIFTVEDIAEEFNCSLRKAAYLLAELDSGPVKLIERKRQGFGRPNLIYIKNFMKPLEDVQEGEVPKNKTCKSLRIKTCKNVHIKTCKSLHIKKCKNLRIKTCKSLHIKTCKIVHPNKTNINKTDISKTDILSINQSINTNSTLSSTLEAVKQRICYDALIADGENKNIVDEITELMAEALYLRKPIKIGETLYPYDYISSRMSLINLECMRYILLTLSNLDKPVHNIKSYLLAVILNAPATMSNYYDARLKADMTDCKVQRFVKDTG